MFYRQTANWVYVFLLPPPSLFLLSNTPLPKVCTRSIRIRWHTLCTFYLSSLNSQAFGRQIIYEVRTMGELNDDRVMSPYSNCEVSSWLYYIRSGYLLNFFLLLPRLSDPSFLDWLFKNISFPFLPPSFPPLSLQVHLDLLMRTHLFRA